MEANEEHDRSNCLEDPEREEAIIFEESSVAVGYSFEQMY